jgi:hypothetical protein
MLRRLSGRAALAALLVLAGGCGQKVYRVTGTVTSNGKPIDGLVVHFVPERGTPSWGTTDEKGAFALRFDKTTEGAVRGKHRVWVEYRPRDPRQEAAYHEGRLKLPAEVRAALEKYGEKASKLTVEVTRNEQVIELALD